MIWMLLQEGGAPQGDPPPAGVPGSDMLLLIGGVMVIFYFLMWRPQAKERKKRESMLSALKKGDRVMTSAGIFGTVAALSEKEVVLKVDEKNNTRMRFTRSAVTNVLNEDGEAPEGATS